MAKPALVAITRRGARHAASLAEQWSEAVCFVLKPWDVESGVVPVRSLERPLRCHVATLLTDYDPVCFFCSVGAVVRLVASHLKSKQKDSAVLAIDEMARFVVPVVSGHLGGANEAARSVAHRLGATPVITTASDAAGIPAVDLLGKQWGWRIEADVQTQTRTAAKMVNGESVAVVQECGNRQWLEEFPDLPDSIQILNNIDEADPERFSALLWITRQPVSAIWREKWPESLVVYRPPEREVDREKSSLVVGLGCDRGVAWSTLERALRKNLDEHDLDHHAITTFATIDLKQDEAAFSRLARAWNRPFQYYSAEQLATISVPNPSEKVRDAVGVSSVAEAAAMAASQRGASSLLVEKQCYRGDDGKNVTIAIAAPAACASSEHGKMVGRITLVSIGPGCHDLLSDRAREAIRRADVVIGYKTYLKLIEALLDGAQEVISSGMRQELQRCTEACRLAMAGREVALISSGDVGIYGMAGPTYEMLFQAGWQPGSGVTVEVIPGVTALAACAALAGAPLTHDFCAISLSDLLTPWSVIENRLEAAARADFVTALYNPKSGQRTEQIFNAQAIFLKHRDSKTPVAVVTAAYRPAERIVMTDLENMSARTIGMQTTLLIGNSDTFQKEGLMITPRGYGTKYNYSSVAQVASSF